ncbi:hypothetical protein ABPG74_018589 [Tetrahymena malaccensis]
MGCVDSRSQQNEIKTAPTPQSMLHRMELLTSATTLQSESDQETTFNKELDRFQFYFNQSSIVKIEGYQKNIQEMNRLRQENHLDSQFFNNQYLYRFMKARHFDMHKSIKMFKDHLHWRKENKIDTILKDFVFWESDEVQEIYPHGYHKTDKEGRPIYIEIFKNVTFKDLYSITTQDRMKKHYYQNYEQLINKMLPCASIAANKYVGQTLTILDAKDMKLKPMEAKNFVQLVTSFSESNYPEIMGKLYVVNSPMLAQVFWKVISVMLNETIKSKICILGKDYKQKLLENIDKENLPEFLGGESDTQNGALLRKNIGPWNEFGKQKMFPHEDERILKNITQQEKDQLKQDIFNFQNKRQSVQERASQRNSVNQRQSIIKIQQNEANSLDKNSNDNNKHIDYNVNILDNLEKEQIPK